MKNTVLFPIVLMFFACAKPQTAARAPAPVSVPPPGMSDLGATIQSISDSFGGNGGTIEVPDGGGQFLTGVHLGPGITIHFGIGVFVNHVNGTLLSVEDNTIVKGSGWNTIIMESDQADASQGAYFVWRPYNEQGPSHNLTLSDLQILGASTLTKGNGAASTVQFFNTQVGVMEHVWINGTHAIGAQIGGVNLGPGQYADSVIIRNCLFNAVGGAQLGAPGGGGVSAAITNAQNSSIEDCTFTQPMGNAVIDIEPNVTQDRVINCKIARNHLYLLNPALPVYGIVATNDVHATVYGNLFDSNTVDGTGNAYPPSESVEGLGVALDGSTVSNNMVINCATAFGIASNTAPISHVVMRNNRSIGLDGSKGLVVVNVTHCQIVSNVFDQPVVESVNADYNLYANNIAQSISLVGAHSASIGTLNPL